ncbi:MAG: hypothetical protein AVDCRST_MAG37-2788, partial [uncultured Rubrobacteraceae bacterium]
QQGQEGRGALGPDERHRQGEEGQAQGPLRQV